MPLDAAATCTYIMNSSAVEAQSVVNTGHNVLDTLVSESPRMGSAMQRWVMMQHALTVPPMFAHTHVGVPDDMLACDSHVCCMQAFHVC